jgi:FkbM family methyltransferase
LSSRRWGGDGRTAVVKALRDAARAYLPAGLLDRLALTKQWLDLRHFRSYAARHIYGELPLVVHVADETSQRWYDRDWQCPEEIVLLAERGQLRPGATVFDIGAHQAVVAMLLAARVEPGGRVIAVEPTLHNIETARRNLAANGVTSVELLHAAAADVSGSISFSPRLNGRVAVAGTPGVNVRAVTADELASVYGSPQVIFVDVEGFELHVLRGARDVLRSVRPDLFIEVHAGVGLETFGTVDDLLALIPAGYTVLVSETAPTNFRPLADGDTRRVLERHALLVALASR